MDHKGATSQDPPMQQARADFFRRRSEFWRMREPAPIREEFTLAVGPPEKC